MILDQTTQYSLLTETGPRQEMSLRRKAELSKLKSLTGQLQNLLQKKIRLDIEIRNTRKKLSKLKSSSSTTLRTSIKLEGVDLSVEPVTDLTLLESGVSSELTEEFIEFDKALDEADTVLSLIKDLPLYNN